MHSNKYEISIPDLQKIIPEIQNYSFSLLQIND